MTALPGRRRRSTIVAAVAAGVVAALAVALTILGGAVTLYNSTDGADASSDRGELVFPTTPVGALAAVDADGKLASIAVLVVQPAGAGGSIVTVPVSADASGGSGGERLPLAETMSLEGTDALQGELEVLLRLSIDELQVVDAAALTELLAPVGDLDVDLPADVTDASGEVVADAGAATIDATTAAAVLTARDPAVPAARQYGAANAVWSAVAAAVGDGVVPAAGSTEPTTPSTAATTSDATGIDGMFDALIAGRVGQRSLRAIPVDAAENPRGVDVCLLDPAEVALVFAQIAPGSVSAPGPGLSFRIVSAFTDDQLAGSGLTNDEVAYAAISSLLGVGANVLSVSTDGDVPSDATLIEVADVATESGVQDADEVFGTVDVVLAEVPIAGVDVIAELGTDFLATVVAARDQPTATTTTGTTATTVAGPTTETTEDDDGD